uniref:Arginine vasopressin-induced protein 1 n=1 Tax=Oryzias latipes TaxID=8090 RepID=H2LTV4_ORYLA
MDDSSTGPSSLWRLAERRSRKAGSGNIFSNVNLWQLQRLFRAAGDHDAEQRAKLVWGLGDEADLAQALIGLRARKSHRQVSGESEGGSGTAEALPESQCPEGTAERPVPVSSGLRRGGESNPDRYLHQILH